MHSFIINKFNFTFSNSFSTMLLNYLKGSFESE